MTDLLSRLEGVIHRSNGQFYAKCPSHDDKSPSLSIKLCDDGTILVHCFAGCEPIEVVEAVGLSLGDLFPEKPKSTISAQPRKVRHNPSDLLLLLAHEALIVLFAAEDLARGEVLGNADHKRLIDACRKINGIVEAL